MSSCEPLSLDWLDEELSASHSVDQRSMNRATVQGELEKRLRCRADRDDLVKKHILPDLSTSPVLYGQTQLLQRAQIADTLKKKLSSRAERNELLQLNILPDLQTTIAPKLQAKQLELKKHKLADSLNEKLANRPGPLELVREGILEPKNNTLAAMVQSVDGNNEPLSVEGGGGGHPTLSTCGFSDSEFLSPPETQKISDSSSPTPSPREGSVEASSPVKSLMSPPTFPGSFSTMAAGAQQHFAYSVELGTRLGKAMSPSVIRKKQQKQQKYRKLRYHEYIPPSKNNGKGGKTNQKTHTSSKPESPYSVLLQQQQLFLQLQVLQQQYPNGVLMQKLPDILKGIKQDGSSSSSSSSGGRKDSSGTGKSQTSPSGAEKSGSSSTPGLPQTVQVEQPNHLNATTIRFDELKVSDLKTACKEMRLIVSGKKAELVERLLEHNNGYLPVCALPDGQSKDARKCSGAQSTASFDSSQASAASPMSPTLSSPIFKFPHIGGVSSSSVVDCLSSISPLGGPAMAQVFPASNFQQQFDEIVERQKRSYISQKAPKTIAPRPELNDMVAIRFPCLEQRGVRGVGAPNNGGRDGRCPPGGVQASKSLPTSPKNASPTDSAQSLLNELMESGEGVAGEDVKPPGFGGETLTSQPSGLQSTRFSESLGLTTPSLSVMHSPSPHSGYIHQQQIHHHHQQQQQQQSQQRLHRASMPAVPGQNPLQTLRYEQPLIQRSLSVAGVPLSQLSTSTSSSTTSYPSLPEMGSGGTGDLGKAMSSNGLLLGQDEGLSMAVGGELMEIETSEFKDQPLSDILDIFPPGSNEYNAHQPHTLGYDNKALRVDMSSSDDIMLSSHPLQPFGNSLNHQSRSTSDLCLRDNTKSNLGGGGGGYGNNHMISSEFGWLDLTLDNMGTFGLSPSPSIGSAAAMSHSNPNSLMQDSNYMYFMDDSSVHSKGSNPPTGVSVHHHDATTFLEPVLNPASHFFPTSEEATLLELGLSTS